MLRGRIEPGVAAAHDVDEILSATHRAEALTRQLLAFSRRQLIRPQPLDLNKLLADMSQMLHRLIDERIELTIAAAPELSPVVGDVNSLEQVVLNLVLNARDAMPQGGRLVLQTAKARFENGGGDCVRLSVIDTGMGIPKPVLAHLFEPFFTTKPAGAGTGLGLSTVYGIVKQHGGHIRASTEPGRGTRFDIDLPCAGEGVEPSMPQSGPGTLPRGTETVLVVEDEPSVREVMARVLEMLGYCVLEANDGLDATERMRACDGSVALVISDVIMPRMTGRELSEYIAEEWPNTRMLLTSGYTQEHLGKYVKLSVNAAFLSKPFTPDSLARKVREVLDSSA